MGLDLFDAPLRITWNLKDEAPLSALELGRIVDNLVEAGVFFVTLDGSAWCHPNIEPLIRQLVAGAVQVTLVLPLHRAAVSELKPGWPLDRLLLDVGDVVDDAGWQSKELVEAVEQIKKLGYHPELQLLPLRGRLEQLPRLLQLARETGVAGVKLPNIPLVDHPALRKRILNAGDLESFRYLAPTCRRSAADLKLEVHDLFLWELLCPDAPREHYSGCQAGNGLAHISAEGDFYPCSSWPARLGSLLKHQLTELWQSQLRHAICSEIATVPNECSDCQAYEICFGGCRGLAHVLGTAQSRDPLCKEPR